MAVRFITIEYQVDSSALRTSEEQIRRIARSLGVTEDQVRDVSEEYDRAAQSASDLADETQESEKQSKALMGTMKKLGGIIAGAFAVSKITSFVKNAVGLAATMEQNRIAFTSFTGSAEAANKILGEIETFAASTPFQFPDLVSTSKNLLAFGIQQERILPILKTLGDISAGTGKNINELGLIFGKITTKGKAQTEELNQLAEAGIPIIQVLAEQYGKTAAEIFKMAEQSELTADVVNEAFQTMTTEGGIFFDLTAKQSQSTAGKFSTLQDNVERIARSFGESLLPAVNTVLDGLLSLIAPTEKESDLLREQQAEVNILTGILLDNESALETREEVIRQLAAIQPELVEGINAQNIEEEELRKRLEAANNEFAKRIQLALAQEKVNAILEQQRDLVEASVKAEIAINRAFAERFGQQAALNTGLTEQIEALRGVNEQGLLLNASFQLVEQREKALKVAADELAAAQGGLTKAQVEAGITADQAAEAEDKLSGSLDKTGKSASKTKKEIEQLVLIAGKLVRADLEATKDLEFTFKPDQDVIDENVTESIIAAIEQAEGTPETAVDLSVGEVDLGDLPERLRQLNEQFFAEDGPDFFESLFGDPQEFLNRAVEVSRQTADIIGTFQTARFNRERAQLDAQFNRELTAAGENATARAAIEEKFQAKRDALDRDRAEKQRRLAIFEALIAGAVAVVQALPDPIRVAFATLVTLAQVTAIRSQAFREGVIDLQGPGTGTSDSIPARLSKGESVMTAAETKKYKPILMAMRRGEPMPMVLRNDVLENSFGKIRETQNQDISIMSGKLDQTNKLLKRLNSKEQLILQGDVFTSAVARKIGKNTQFWKGRTF